MKAFGYSYNSDELLELSECTLECTLEEIESLAFFLTKFKNKVATGIEEMVHRGRFCVLAKVTVI